MYTKKYYLFETVGTLCYTISGQITPNHFEDFFVAPNVLYILKHLYLQGKRFALVADCGGVSHGIVNEKQCWEIFLELNALLEGMFSIVKVNYHHARGNWKDFHQRISKVEMCLQVAIEFEKMTATALPDLELFAFVGNGQRDHKELTEYGIECHWPHNFFKWPVDKMITDSHGPVLNNKFLEPHQANAIRGLRVAGTLFKKGI